jgi:hypothetical protein
MKIATRSQRDPGVFRQITPPTVIAMIALFVSLSGTVLAQTGSGGGGGGGPLPGSNTVYSSDIVAGAVRSSDIGLGAVTSSDISNVGIRTSDIGEGAVTGPKIGDGQVGSSDLGEGVVTDSKVAAGSIGKSKFAASGLATSSFTGSLSPGACVEAIFDAPGVQPGDVVIFNLAGFEHVLYASAPDNTVPLPGEIKLALCNPSAITTTKIGEHAVTIGYVAIR